MNSYRAAVLALGVAAGLVSGAWAAPEGVLASDPAAELGLPTAVAAAMQGIDAQRIRAQVRFLSDDLLEGRGTGARGGDIAAKYIATQFALDGLQPAGDNGSYLQKVEFAGVQTLPRVISGQDAGHDFASAQAKSQAEAQRYGRKGDEDQLLE